MNGVRPDQFLLLRWDFKHSSYFIYIIQSKQILTDILLSIPYVLIDLLESPWRNGKRPEPVRVPQSRIARTCPLLVAQRGDSLHSLCHF